MNRRVDTLSGPPASPDAVRVSGLRKAFGNSPHAAVDGLDFVVGTGEFLVLLGPSGCGKTTTLRCIAGLESATEGRIELRGDIVFDAEAGVDRSADKRSIGMVFQSYALWPHLTVRRNLEYPLKARKVKHGLAAGWVEETARMVECSHLLDRYPSQLSGGQQQRVALARGLVARPELVLFDEPLSNLDARLRKSVRIELHALHRELGFTAIYVTHDQEEAFALGTRLAIMRDGRIEQLATPTEVTRAPANEYVAEFIGLSNRLLVSADGHGDTVADGCPVGGDVDRLRRGRPCVAVRVRPEDTTITPVGAIVAPGTVTVAARFVDATFNGRARDVVARVGGTTIEARVVTDDSTDWLGDVRPGDEVAVSFRTRAAVAFTEPADARGVVHEPVEAGR